MATATIAVPVEEPEVEAEAAPPGTITQNDETREMFADCVVGDEKWVRMRIDTHDDTAIAFTPLEVEYEEEAVAAEPEAEGAAPKAFKKISEGGY